MELGLWIPFVQINGLQQEDFIERITEEQKAGIKLR